MNAAFIEAAEPRPRRVLGLELLPLSIGHYILLERHESVFVSSGGGGISLEDALLAVLICSQKYEDARKALRSRWLHWFVRFWGWRCRKLNIFAEIKALSEYISAINDNAPDVVRSDVNGEPQSSLPGINTLRVFLMADLHVSPSEVLDYSILQAQWDFQAFMALRGHDQSVSPALDEAIRLAKAEDN